MRLQPAAAPDPDPAVNLRAPVSGAPFAPSQRQAQKRVERAQAALPKQPTPNIPRIANPTPSQTRAALQLAHESQRRAVGPNASVQRVRAYQQELAADPRQRQYVQTLTHYAKAAEGHAAELAGRVAAGGGENVASARTPAGMALSRREAEQLGRSVLASGGRMPAAEPSVLAQAKALSSLAPLRTANREAAARYEAREPGVNVPGAGVIHPFGILAALGNIHIAPKGVVGNIVNEAIDMPAQTLLSGAIAGAATRKAIEGKPQQLENVGGGLLQQVEHPVHSFEQAPRSTALTLAGAEAGAESLVAKGLRTVGPQGVKDALSTARPDLRLYGEPAPPGAPVVDPGAPAVKPGANPRAPVRAVRVDPGAPTPRQGLRVSDRTYSPVPSRMVVQKTYEKALTKLPEGLRQKDPFQAEGWRLRRNLVGGDFTKVGRVDRIRAAGEQTRRQFVKGTIQQVAASKPKVGEHAVPLIFQGIVRTPATLVGDLTKEAEKLKAVQPELSRSQLAANKANLGHVQGLLSDKAFLAHPEEAFAAAERYRALQRPLEAILIHGGKLAPEAVRSKLFPYAQAHMGAVYDGTALRGPSDVAYRGSHQAPTAAEGAVPLHQVSQADLQAMGHPEFQGKPNAQVTIHRATPGGAINPGDWVTLKPPTHAVAPHLGKVESARVPASSVLYGGKGPNEFGAHEFRYEPRSGGTLSNAAIKAHMAANGVQDVGFLSHKPGITGGSSFYKATTRMPGLEKYARTGAAFNKGIADHSFAGLSGSIARQASEAAQLEVRARELSQIALIPKGGGFASKEAALNYAQNSAHHLSGGEPVHSIGNLVPVHLGSDPILERGNVNPADVQATLKQFGLSQEKSAVSKQNGKFGLAPDAVLKRFAAHDEALGAKSNVTRALQAYQQGFRRAKLNTSTRHYFGVMQEQGIRLGMEGAGNQARRAGKKFDTNLKQLAQVDEGGHLADNAGPLGGRFRELEAQLGTRGGQVAAQKANDVVRKGNAWQGTSGPAFIAQTADGVAHSKVGKAILAPWHLWQHAAEGSLSKIEQGTHHALLGKALKESGFIDSYRSALKMQDSAMQDLVKGGLTSNKADALARHVDEMMGNWSHQTPAVRKLVGNYAPFGLWWLNSMRWLYRLPVTHPVKTAILSSLYNATRNERNAKGQGFDAAHPVPSFLQGTIDTHLPVVGKVSIAPSYYSPGGTGGPEAFNTAAEQFLPAGQSVYDAARGQNPLTGAELRDAKGQPINVLSKALNVGTEAAAGPLPFATQVQSLLQGGGKPFGTANLVTDLASKLGGQRQVKPGSERPLDEQLVKLFSPLRFNYPAAGSRGSTGGPSGGVVSGRAPSARQELLRESRTQNRGAISPIQELRRRR